MKLDDLTDEWRRWLVQADAFARAGATDEAVARALAVQQATAEALRHATPSHRAIILEHSDRSRHELARLRALHRSQRLRTAARSTTHYEAERRAAATPTRQDREPPLPE